MRLVAEPTRKLAGEPLATRRPDQDVARVEDRRADGHEHSVA
jgi:hypothetical protein